MQWLGDVTGLLLLTLSIYCVGLRFVNPFYTHIFDDDDDVTDWSGNKTLPELVRFEEVCAA